MTKIKNQCMGFMLTAIPLLSLSTPCMAQNPYLPLWEHVPDGEPRRFEDPEPREVQSLHHRLSRHILQVLLRIRHTHVVCPNRRPHPVERRGSHFFLSHQQSMGHHVCSRFGRDKTKRWNKRLLSLSSLPRIQACENGLQRQVLLDGPFHLHQPQCRWNGRAARGSILTSTLPYTSRISLTRRIRLRHRIQSIRLLGILHLPSAAQLDPSTMYSLRPGTELIKYSLPACDAQGNVRDPKGTTYPINDLQKPTDFNFFEASSIRKVGNKYVMIYSGYSGKEYGLGNTNSTLRYAYGDTPLGPWKNGGVLVDSRGVVFNQDCTKPITSNAAHNTHGSLQEINGQWYVFFIIAHHVDLGLPVSLSLLPLPSNGIRNLWKKAEKWLSGDPDHTTRKASGPPKHPTTQNTREQKSLRKDSRYTA